MVVGAVVGVVVGTVVGIVVGTVVVAGTDVVGTVVGVVETVVVVDRTVVVTGLIVVVEVHTVFLNRKCALLPLFLFQYLEFRISGSPYHTRFPSPRSYSKEHSKS